MGGTRIVCVSVGVGSSSRTLRFLVIVAAVSLSTLFPKPANAIQDAPGVTPGAIVVSRDVPERYAYLPGEPGKPTYVETVPQAVFEVGATVVRLTDEQSALVGSTPLANSTSSADPLSILQGTGVAADTSLGGTAGVGGMQGGGIAGLVGGAVSQGVGAIQSSLSAVGAALDATKP